MPENRELWDKGLVAVNRAREIFEAAEAEGRKMNEEETAHYDAAIEDANRYRDSVKQDLDLRARAKAFEDSRPQETPRVEDIREREKDNLPEPTPQLGLGGPTSRVREFIEGKTPNYTKWSMTPEFYGSAVSRSREGGVIYPNGQPRVRDLGTNTDAGGGVTVDSTVMQSLEQAMLRYNSVMGVATIINTMDGSPLSMPTVNDTNRVAGIVAEHGPLGGELDPVFDSVSLPVFKFSSRPVHVSIELIQDSIFNIEAYVGEALGTRLGRGEGAMYTNGDGNNKPQGIVTAATAGKTITTSATLAYEDVIDLMISVDGAYAMNGSWMFNRNLLGALMKLKGSDGQPIWHRSVAMGHPDMLLGRPIFENDHMDSLTGTAGNKVMLFGDLSKFHVRRAMDVEVYRQDELYIQYGQIGFVAICRSGSAMLDAGTNPVKALVDKA